MLRFFALPCPLSPSSFKKKSCFSNNHSENRPFFPSNAFAFKKIDGTLNSSLGWSWLLALIRSNLCGRRSWLHNWSSMCQIIFFWPLEEISQCVHVTGLIRITHISNQLTRSPHFSSFLEASYWSRSTFNYRIKFSLRYRQRRRYHLAFKQTWSIQPRTNRLFLAGILLIINDITSNPNHNSASGSPLYKTRSQPRCLKASIEMAAIRWAKLRATTAPSSNGEYKVT